MDIPDNMFPETWQLSFSTLASLSEHWDMVSPFPLLLGSIIVLPNWAPVSQPAHLSFSSLCLSPQEDTTMSLVPVRVASILLPDYAFVVTEVQLLLAPTKWGESLSL